MRISLFIGLRFLRAKRVNRTVSAITWFSMVGVMLGVMALIVAVSVMNGFRENMLLAVTGTQPHITLLASGEGMSPAELAEVRQKLAAMPGVVATAPYFSRQVFLAVGDEFRAVFLRGIDPPQETATTNLKLFFKNPSLLGMERPPLGEGERQKILDGLAYPPPPGERAGIVLGAPLVNSMGLFLGDPVRVISPAQRMTPVGPVPLMKQFRLVGAIETGLSNADEVSAYVDYRIAQRLFRAGDTVPGVGVKLNDPNAVDAEAFRKAFPTYHVIAWNEENINLFQVMKLEKMGLFLVLTLIIVVSFFNIISSLVMLVLEKRKAIAILKTMGARDSTIRRIFFAQGVGIGTAGTVGGVALGLLGCWVLSTFDIIKIPPGVFPLSNQLHVVVSPLDVAWIAAASFVICLAVTLYPATRAARVQPVENLRYE